MKGLLRPSLVEWWREELACLLAFLLASPMHFFARRATASDTRLKQRERSTIGSDQSTDDWFFHKAGIRKPPFLLPFQAIGN